MEEINTPNTEGTNTAPAHTETEMVEKKALDKALKEKAELQRALNAKKTEDEIAKEAQEKKDKELEELRNYQKKSILQNGLLSEKVNAKDATTIAETILTGNMENIAKVLGSALNNAVEEAKKEVLRDALNNTLTPKGNAGSDDKPTDFKTMSLDERMELKASNPELYEKLKNA